MAGGQGTVCAPLWPRMAAGACRRTRVCLHTQTAHTEILRRADGRGHTHTHTCLVLDLRLAHCRSVPGLLEVGRGWAWGLHSRNGLASASGRRRCELTASFCGSEEGSFQASCFWWPQVCLGFGCVPPPPPSLWPPPCMCSSVSQGHLLGGRQMYGVRPAFRSPSTVCKQPACRYDPIAGCQGSGLQQFTP